MSRQPKEIKERLALIKKQTNTKWEIETWASDETRTGVYETGWGNAGKKMEQSPKKTGTDKMTPDWT